jgi:O-antigen ligase
VSGGVAIFFEWLLLAAGLVMVTLPAVYLNMPWLAALPLGICFAVRAARTHQLLPRTSLSLPWLVFIASAAWGAWISIDQVLAQAQLVRLLAAFVVFCALVSSGFRWQRGMAWLLLAGMAFLALYWPLKNPFMADPGKFSLISRIGAAINAVLPAPPGPVISPNVMGGMLVLAVPFGAALAWIGWRERRPGHVCLAGGLTILVIVGLLLTSSRGAMLGLMAAGGLAALAWVQTRWFGAGRQKMLFWGAFGIALVVLIFGLIASGQIDRLVGAVPDPTGSLVSRVQIWRQGIPLIRDYLFTGAGLASFPIVFSVYRLLIHVPYHEHLHNIFLESWYEQGILGLAAMLWGMLVVVRCAWRGLTSRGEAIEQTSFDSQSAVRILGWAGMAALVAMGVHGMVDVVFMVKRSLPLVGLVIGYTTLVKPLLLPMVEPAAAPAKLGRRKRAGIAALGGGVALLLILAFYRPLLASWYANLGALTQARMELSRYDPDHFDRPTLDQIRREIDLGDAQRSFQQALNYQPNERTAIQRLALISLSRGEYETARLLLDGAMAAGEHDQVTRLLYGDMLVAEGRLPEAADAVRGIDWANDRLMWQAWYRYWLDGDIQRAANAWKTVLLLDPANQDAQGWLAKLR